MFICWLLWILFETIISRVIFVPAIALLQFICGSRWSFCAFSFILKRHFCLMSYSWWLLAKYIPCVIVLIYSLYKSLRVTVVHIYYILWVRISICIVLIFRIIFSKPIFVCILLPLFFFIFSIANDWLSLFFEYIFED